RCLGCESCFEACPEQAISVESPFPSPKVCTLCGTCVDACPSGARRMIGQSMTVEQVLAEVMRDRAFYEESGGGVTFTGGEPLTQTDFLLACLAECRANGLHTTFDTCGYAHWDDLKAAAGLSNLVLYDVKGIDDERHQATTGVSNHRILRNLYCLATLEVEVWVRVPLVPGVNDDEGSLKALGGFLADLPRRFPVWLLPYHRLGRQKRNLIGMAEACEFPEPSLGHVADCAEILQSYGIEVRTKP
ncbi:MAG TPA: glycyl-radical enzyme activating protein, partial [Fimbriimonas sp.]